MEISQVSIHVHFVFLLGESLTSRYSRNTDQRLHASFSSGEFGRLKPKDMSSPLVSDHNDSARRVISPIRRRSDDDVSIATCLISRNICLLRFMITGCGVASLQTLSRARGGGTRVESRRESAGEASGGAGLFPNQIVQKLSFTLM